MNGILSLKGLARAAAALAIAALPLQSTYATPTSFTLNCALSIQDANDFCTTTTGNFGTISLEDIGNSLRVTVDLVDPKIADRIYLNFGTLAGQTLSTSNNFWRVTWAGSTGTQRPTFSNNASGPDGYARLDIAVNPSIAIDPLTFDLSLYNTSTSSAQTIANQINLDLGNFLFRDANNLVAVVCTTASPCDQDRDVSYGAFVGANTSLTSTDVPEPGTIALLGLSLFGLNVVRRKRAV